MVAVHGPWRLWHDSCTWTAAETNSSLFLHRSICKTGCVHLAVVYQATLAAVQAAAQATLAAAEAAALSLLSYPAGCNLKDRFFVFVHLPL